MGFAVAALVAISVRSEAVQPDTQDIRTTAARQPDSEVGLASWYGAECAGNPTANGEPYDMNGLTAANWTLPFGTWIKVTNLRNSRSVILRVNDRGPGVPGRILDVSMEAAKRLGFKGMGLTTVEIEVVSYPRRYLASLAKQVDQLYGPPNLGSNGPGCPTGSGLADCTLLFSATPSLQD